LAVSLTITGITYSAELVIAEHWVGGWATAPEDLRSVENDIAFGGKASHQSLNNQTIRMVIHTTLPGKRVRLRFDNRYGETDLSIDAASVGLTSHDASLRRPPVAITFNGERSVKIAAAANVVSDPVNLAVGANEALSVSAFFDRITSISTSHSIDSIAGTSYIAVGDSTMDVEGHAYVSRTIGWDFLDAVDVDTSMTAFSIVLLGDSITDGYGLSVDKGQRWSDCLAARIRKSDVPASVLNLGISGNRVLPSNMNSGQSGDPGRIFGASALSRFDHDVLDQSEVRFLFILEGINDIGIASPEVTADQIVSGLRLLVARAHEHGIRVYGSTLTPALGTAGYDQTGGYTLAKEAKRVAVNAAIRNLMIFDAVVDFDRIVRDARAPAHWRNGLSVDELHPNLSASRLMCRSVPLDLFMSP
jgi:lysophospholipase L1-like esterase